MSSAYCLKLSNADGRGTSWKFVKRTRRVPSKYTLVVLGRLSTVDAILLKEQGDDLVRLDRKCLEDGEADQTMIEYV